MTAALALLAAAIAAAPSGRVVTDLSGPGWRILEPGGIVRDVAVPHSWNVSDGADGLGVDPKDRFLKNSSCISSYERKMVVYSRQLPPRRPGRRYFVRCEGASSFAEVFVNGVKAGEHLGAFTAFAFEVTSAMSDADNVLEIAVDNFPRDGVTPPVNADFTMYGGLYRGVALIETPLVCIDPVADGASGVRLFPDPDTGEVRAEIRVLGGPDETRLFRVDGFALWSPETPVVYTQRFEIASGDAVTETFGFRKAEFRRDGFYLNGVKRTLYGVNYHQDMDGKGWALSAEDRRRDVAEMRFLGCNAVRTAHYPHSALTYSLCDEAGLVAWCEHPNVNGLRFSAVFESNMRRQVREMVMQLSNHPSIVCWSIFNELYNKVRMEEGKPEAMMESLRDYVRTLDPSRAVAAASDRPEKVRLSAVPDALGFNRYPGWYGGGPETMGARIDEIFSRNPSVASIGMTEYGAGAGINTHGDPLKPCEPLSDVHTEEYQAYVHSVTYRALADDPRVWGSFVWCMYDFGSDCRLEGERHGINDKGLVTWDRSTRKDAWYFYHANWTTNAVLRLVGARGVSAPSARVNVLGISNVGRVTLSVNGREIGAADPDRFHTVMWRDVPLSEGDNEVRLSAGGRVSAARWRLGTAP